MAPTSGRSNKGERSRGTANGIVTLRPVGVTEDGSYVTLARRSTAKSGGWRIAVDEALLTFLEEAIVRAEKAAPAPTEEPADLFEPEPEPEPEPEFEPMRDPEPVRVAESKLSPKEIQALLRQGRSVTSIARRAGVSAEWVERFEVPIIWERAGMVTRARKAPLLRPRQGPAGKPLGEAVLNNLRARRVRMSDEDFEAAWDAVRNARTGLWTITFAYASRGREQKAQWEFDPDSLDVRPLDKLASQLGWAPPPARRKRAAATR